MWFKLEYEGLNLVWFDCRRFGHMIKGARLRVKWIKMRKWRRTGKRAFGDEKHVRYLRCFEFRSLDACLASARGRKTSNHLGARGKNPAIVSNSSSRFTALSESHETLPISNLHDFADKNIPLLAPVTSLSLHAKKSPKALKAKPKNRTSLRDISSRKLDTNVNGKPSTPSPLQALLCSHHAIQFQSLMLSLRNHKLKTYDQSDLF